ncbi:MAG: hypothetical protein L3J29_10955 [Cyclobacteriaceae bacterium]|nr:hypothetical protein [Cyclobacteriaceae bacterium]
MKTINNFLIAGFVLFAFACNTSMDDMLSSTDIAALQAMEASYAGAVEANNTLATYVETTGITNDQTCFGYDSSFHQNDSTFEAGHMMYSHNNSGDDHNSNSWSMGSGMNGSSGGMMGGNHSGGGFNSQNCSQSNLELMDSLMLAHEQYHPED